MINYLPPLIFVSKNMTYALYNKYCMFLCTRVIKKCYLFFYLNLPLFVGLSTAFYFHYLKTLISSNLNLNILICKCAPFSLNCTVYFYPIQRRSFESFLYICFLIISNEHECHRLISRRGNLRNFFISNQAYVFHLS